MAQALVVDKDRLQLSDPLSWSQRKEGRDMPTKIIPPSRVPASSWALAPLNSEVKSRAAPLFSTNDEV